MPHRQGAKGARPLWTIILSFGPSMPPFQQHFTDGRAAKLAALALKDRMLRAQGKCIENVQLWNAGSLIKSWSPGPPIAVWLPPPDANGVRHIPEKGRRRLPSVVSAPAPERPANYDPSELYI